MGIASVNYCYIAALILIIDTVSPQIVRCLNENCDCPEVTLESSTALCILDCHSSGICQGQTLNCRDNDICHIICDGEESCSNTIINGNTATDLTIICSTANACTDNMHIKCSTDHCIIQCDTENSCADVAYIELSLTSTFECIGHCPDGFPSVLSYSSSLIATTSYAQPLDPVPMTAVTAVTSFNTVVTVIVVLICILSIIILTIYGCWFCYIRMNDKLKKQITLHNTQQMQSKTMPSPVHIALSPIIKEKQQLTVFTQEMTQMNADDYNDGEESSQSETHTVSTRDHTASWLYENISTCILSPLSRAAIDERNTEIKTRDINDSDTESETETNHPKQHRRFKSLLDDHIAFDLAPIECCDNESSYSSESESVSNTNNTRVTHSSVLSNSHSYSSVDDSTENDDVQKCDMTMDEEVLLHIVDRYPSLGIQIVDHNSDSVEGSDSSGTITLCSF